MDLSGAIMRGNECENLLDLAMTMRAIEGNLPDHVSITELVEDGREELTRSNFNLLITAMRGISSKLEWVVAEALRVKEEDLAKGDHAKQQEAEAPTSVPSARAEGVMGSPPCIECARSRWDKEVVPCLDCIHQYADPADAARDLVDNFVPVDDDQCKICDAREYCSILGGSGYSKECGGPFSVRQEVDGG